jgi:ubiquitin
MMVAGSGRSLNVVLPTRAIQFRQFVPIVASRYSNRRSSPFLRANNNDEDNNEPTEQPTTTPATESNESVVTQDKGGKKKNSLSLIPLFFKFCVVLAVKFITDVLVFPPLFFWRFVRLVYRKCRNVLLGKGSKDGSSSTAS